MSDRAKLTSALEHVAAEYINRESNRRSLITVTRVHIDERNTTATIFVSIYPENQSAAALDFLGRSLPEFKEFIRTRIRSRVPGSIQFQHDPNIAGVEPAV